MNTGIYSITAPTGRCYIGSALRFSVRWANHRASLRKGVHHNAPLQFAYHKYGEDGLAFKKILICKKEDLLFYEQLLIDNLRPDYNVCKVAGNSLGLKHSEETKLKIASLKRGIKQRLEANAKRSATLKIIRNTKEYHDRHSAALKGKKQSPDHVRKRIASVERSVRCIETGSVFQSATAAGRWCVAEGLTVAANPNCGVSRSAAGIQKMAYGYHWEFI